MNSPTPFSDDRASVPESSLPGRLRLFSTVFVLTAATDLLTFGIPAGSGVTLLCGLLWFGLRLNRPHGVTGWKDALLFALMGASAIQTTIEPSFSNGLVLLLLTIYASGHFLHRHIGPYWRRALEGLLGLINIPLILFNLDRSLSDARDSTRTAAFRNTVAQGRRWWRIILPAALVTLPFLILFGRGNAIMGDGMISSLESSWHWVSDFELPSLLRVLFWIAAGLVLLALLSTPPLSPVLAWVENRLPGGWSAPPDLRASIWRTRILLVAVNLTFFAANSVDVFYLWMETALPDGVIYSDYVHQGVYNLIACVALAAGVLLVVFQQDKQVTGAPGQKLLAYVWIGQNLLLVSSVLLRLNLYVDTYHLSLLRLYVVFFLLLVSAGFALLAIKIGQNRNFTWLINTNLLAVFLLFFLVQLLNDRAFVAQFNYNKALRPGKGVAQLDIDYLAQLGPSAWPFLRRVADDAPFFGPGSRIAEAYLQVAALGEEERLAESDWRSWQYRRWVARRSLPGFEDSDDRKMASKGPFDDPKENQSRLTGREQNSRFSGWSWTADPGSGG